MLQTPENSPRPQNRKSSDVSNGSGNSGGSVGGGKSSGSAGATSAGAADFASTINMVNTLASPRSKKDPNNKAAFMTLKAHWLKDAIKNLLPKNSQM